MKSSQSKALQDRLCHRPPSVQDGAHVMVSSQKQQNVDRAVAALQGEGLSVMGIVCHVGKTKDQERLVAMALEHCGGADFLVCVAGVNPLVGSTLES
ncbi:hypothetical protein HPG69_002189, partial [Diceros bicornis minor]